MKSKLFILFLGAAALAACGDDPAGGGGDDTMRDGGGGGGGDRDGGVNTGDRDGGGGSDTDGGGGGDGGMGDGGNPLEQPRSEFCEGEGTVVIVGGGGECAGQIAQDTFRFGVCSCETVEVGSILDIDAFDSTMGPYGGTNIFDDGSLGVNGLLAISGKLTARGSVFVHGGGFAVGPSSDVTGTVYANGDAFQSNSSTHIGRNAFFNGSVTGRFDIDGTLKVPATATVSAQVQTASIARGPIQTVAPCPCAPDEILDVAALTAWAANNNDNESPPIVLTSTTWSTGEGPASINLPCGRYYVTAIDAPNGLTVQAEGRVVLFVDGDMNISGPLSIQTSTDAEVDLFVAGDLAVSSSARFGSSERPAKTRTYVGGTNEIDLGASSVFGGNLYAPRALVRFGAAAEIFGAVFARVVDFEAAARVHFDRAIRTQGEDCEDGGVPMDGGSPDGGSPDGGTPDGSVMIPDGGVGRDAGPRDGGPECTEDIDCPAPELCIDGICRIQF